MRPLMINLNKFSLRYRSSELLAINGLNLEVEHGESILITGPTGCGKTTLLRCLAGLLSRESSVEISGKADVNGYPIDHVNLSEFAPRVGILFQNPDDQITGYTPREEISFGLENLGFNVDEIKERVEAALVEIELLDKADKPIESLSGGQKQRVAAAAVIAMRPDLLLLDEPISNLDWRGRNKLVHLLARLKERGMTIVVCSHENEELRSHADRAVGMQDGSITDEPTTPGSINSVSCQKKAANLDRNLEPLVEFKNVSRRYGRDGFELGPLNLAIRPGEIVALIGPNGSGKTTLISLMAGILKPDGGVIRYFGKTLRHFKRQLLQSIGYISQNPDLMLHHSSVQAEMASRPKNLDINVNIPELTEQNLNRFNLSEFKDHHPFSLSQGQRQRLALGAATAGGASLVMIDEPTTGQDSKQINSLQGHLNELAASGACVLFSTHNFQAVQKIATRIVVLIDGSIWLDGSLEQFLADDDLQDKLYFVPVEVHP